MRHHLQFSHETPDSMAATLGTSNGAHLPANPAVDLSWNRLGKLLKEKKDQIRKSSISSRKPIMRINTSERYLFKKWNDTPLENKRTIVETIERALENKTDVLSLYDMIGLSGQREAAQPWQFKIDISTFDDALKDLQYDTNSNKGENYVLTSWGAIYGNVGINFLLGRRNGVQGRYYLEDFRAPRSDANNAVQAVCPTLENYRKILEWAGSPTSFLEITKYHNLRKPHVGTSVYTPIQRSRVYRPVHLIWQDPVTPKTYPQAQSPPSTSSLPRPATTSPNSPDWTDFNWDLSF